MINIKKEKQIFFTDLCENRLKDRCYVEQTLDILGGKWSYLIIKHLFVEKKRFSQLRKLLHDVNARSLTNALRGLEEHKVINRTVIPTVPVTVEYELTEKGKELKDVIVALYLWGENWAR